MSNPTVVKNADGSFSQVPSTASSGGGGGNLGGFFDLQALGEEPDRNAYADSFKLDALPGFTFQIRMISDRIKERDAGFALRAVSELGLDERARRAYEQSGNDEPTAQQIEDEALRLLGMEVFRSSSELSIKFDHLLRQRYLDVVLGNPDSDDPADWGGLVKWISGALPFSADAVRAANIRLLSQLFTRIQALATYGVDDAGFRSGRR